MRYFDRIESLELLLRECEDKTQIESAKLRFTILKLSLIHISEPTRPY